MTLSDVQFWIPMQPFLLFLERGRGRKRSKHFPFSHWNDNQACSRTGFWLCLTSPMFITPHHLPRIPFPKKRLLLHFSTVSDQQARTEQHQGLNSSSQILPPPSNNAVMLKLTLTKSWPLGLQVRPDSVKMQNYVFLCMFLHVLYIIIMNFNFSNSYHD